MSFSVFFHVFFRISCFFHPFFFHFFNLFRDLKTNRTLTHSTQFLYRSTEIQSKILDITYPLTMALIFFSCLLYFFHVYCTRPERKKLAHIYTQLAWYDTLDTILWIQNCFDLNLGSIHKVADQSTHLNAHINIQIEKKSLNSGNSTTVPVENTTNTIFQ